MRISGLIILSFLMLLPILPGCEKPVQRMNIDPVKSRLVLNGSLGPDMTFKIHISSSMEPLGPELVNVVSDAEIVVTDDQNRTWFPENDSMGFYMMDWRPEVGEKYIISVSAPSFEEASVTVTVPEPVTSASLFKDTTQISYPFILSINDPEGVENIYMVRAWYQYKEYRHVWTDSGEINDTLIEKRKVTLYSPDELITYYTDGQYFGDQAPSEGIRVYQGFLIRDEFFDGKNHMLRFDIKSLYRVDDDRPYLYVELVTVEKALYDFARSYALYYEARSTPFAEPVAILSNIRNGLGFVYGYSVYTDSIRLK